MIYNNGPRQDPFGMPQSRGRLSERALGTETLTNLVDKYDLNQTSVCNKNTMINSVKGSAQVK